MEQFNMNQTPAEEPPKHNIFSSETYGIGRLEFLGCAIIIGLLSWVVQCVIAKVLGAVIDKTTALVFSQIIWVILTMWLSTLNYAHRMYHIGWTDEMNSKTYAGLLNIVCVLGLCIPLINIFAVLLWGISFIVLVAVPGGNE